MEGWTTTEMFRRASPRATWHGRGNTMNEDLQRSLVEQRMTVRLCEPWIERQMRPADAVHRPMRCRLGMALIGLGNRLAGPDAAVHPAG
jgi:hypothetical protein